MFCLFNSINWYYFGLAARMGAARAASADFRCYDYYMYMYIYIYIYISYIYIYIYICIMKQAHSKELARLSNQGAEVYHHYIV